MFTGIVEGMGIVESAQPRADVLVVRIAAPAIVAGMPAGASIAVSGCCLTAVRVEAGGFTTELTRETLERTAFGERLRPGARVNLERPLKADGRFDGHIVQGHVDGVARVVELRRDELSAELVVASPPALRRYLVEKGSLALDGVSLTLASLREDDFTIALIPYTLEHTTLGEARPGARLNVEVDVIAKYVERLLAAHAAAPRA
jgi:riboflavin synthase